MNTAICSFKIRLVETSADFDLLENMLRSAKLPVENFQSMSHFSCWRLMSSGGDCAGFAGVERFGTSGLLRSVVVAPEWRNQGVGAFLIQEVEKASKMEGIRELILLTETAERFFRREGYETITRSEVPESVKASAEFKTSCPASAIAMRKRLI